VTGVALTFGFDDSPIRRHLALLAIADARGFDGVRREIGEYLLGEVQDNLDGQKLFDGKPMPQSEAARTGKGRKGYERRSGKNKGKNKGKGKPGKTLIDKHHLYDSYNYQLTPGGVEIGSGSVYAAIHHFGGETGGRAGRFTMTARPVLGIGAAQEQRLGDFLIAEIQKTQR
jgi:phage gpG-like protein